MVSSTPVKLLFYLGAKIRQNLIPSKDFKAFRWELKTAYFLFPKENNVFGVLVLLHSYTSLYSPLAGHS